MTNDLEGYILYHRFKHHLPYIKHWLKANSGNLSHDNILTIKTLGASQLDMYCGNLGVEDVLQQVAAYLHGAGIHTTAGYKQWVGDGFKLYKLSDDSVFTLRFINNDKPIHLHPARYAPHTVRIKANALKTVICFMLMREDANSLSITTLNNVRQQYLQLPPISVTAGIEELEKVYKLLGL